MEKKIHTTPGPWELGNLLDEQAVLHLAVWPGGMEPGAIGNPVCMVSPTEKLSVQDWANARLIAAAPELLDALRNLQANPNDPRNHRKAMDVMNKATSHL